MFAQNEKIKRDMYIIANSIRIIHKSFFLSLELWNYIIEEVMHTWNRIITSFNQADIISFEYVNDVQSDVSYLRALNCKIDVHVSKIIMRHKLNDRSWKEILMSYEDSNQWNIYNLRTKRVHLSRDVRFDEKSNYYEHDSASSECLKEEKKDNEIEISEIWTEEEDQQMNIFFRSSLSSSSRSSYIHYSTFISDDVEEKKNIEAKKDRQHVSSSIEKETEENTFIFNDKMTASSMLSNSQKLEKKSSENSENRILSLTSETFNNVESTLKATSKRSYNSKSSSSKSDKQTRSIKKSENQFNYKDLHREHLTKFKEEAHMYNVFKALFMSDHMSLSNIKALSLSTLTKFQTYRETRRLIEWSH